VKAAFKPSSSDKWSILRGAHYSKEIVSRARNAGVKFSADFLAHDDRLPFPATLSTEFGGALRELHPNLGTSLYSRTPFPNRQSRVLDNFEQASLDYLMVNPDKEFYRIETTGGMEVVRYARALTMKPDCVACHNRPEYGFDGRWKAGDIRGARQVSMPVPDMAPIMERATNGAIMLAAVAAFLGSALAWPIVRRLQTTVERTESLAEELHAKNAALVEASEVKSRFLAGIGHDLRTPLNAIVGFAQVLRDGQLGTGDNKRSQSYASFIHDSGMHLQGVIEQLLDVSNVESGKWTMIEENIQPADLIRSIRPMLEATLARQEMRLELILEKEEDQVVLRADGRALRRILTNLVDNAANYSEGSVAEIALRGNSNGGMTLSVSDDGIGIAPEAREKVRQLGGRAEDSLLATNLGMGMGLWLVEMLASMHDAPVEINHRAEPWRLLRLHHLSGITSGEFGGSLNTAARNGAGENPLCGRPRRPASLFASQTVEDGGFRRRRLFLAVGGFVAAQVDLLLLELFLGVFV
jgi:signal transduction histidine kinase